MLILLPTTVVPPVPGPQCPGLHADTGHRDGVNHRRSAGVCMGNWIEAVTHQGRVPRLPMQTSASWQVIPNADVPVSARGGPALRVTQEWAASPSIGVTLC